MKNYEEDEIIFGIAIGGDAAEAVKAELLKELEWTQTYSGHKITPTRLLPSQVFRADIEHALSMKCRYNGHCKHFYSVAEHCVFVAAIRGMLQILHLPRPCEVIDLLTRRSDDEDTDFRILVIREALEASGGMGLNQLRRALLHDGSEYALIDVPTPLKRAMPEYKVWERIAEIAIFDRFAVEHESDATIGKTCDVASLFAEKSRLLLHHLPGWGAEIKRDTYATIAAEMIAPRCKIGKSPEKAKKLFRKAWNLLEIGE